MNTADVNKEELVDILRQLPDKALDALIEQMRRMVAQREVAK